MRLAYFSPLNPQRSGISDYSEELLPAFADQAEIDLFVDGYRPANPSITDRFRIFDYRQDQSVLQSLTEYDATICQMGNSYRSHSGIYEVASRHPSVIVFHDFALQHFFLERAKALKDFAPYLDELEISAGRYSRLEAADALARGAAPPQYQNPAGFPMNFGLANCAEGIIVHSEWSRSRLAQIAPGIPIAKINHHVMEMSGEDNRGALKARELSIASFGFITANKGLETVFRALAALKPDHQFHYYLVGEPERSVNVAELVKAYGLSDRVSITGYVDFEELKRRISQTDIGINLRAQTVGETSGSLCRLMGAGVPTIVSDIGWFSEIPGDCVVRIDAVTDADADVAVCTLLKELMENAQLRQTIGANARAYIRTHHTVEQAVAGYLDLIGKVIQSRTRRSFVESVAADIAQLSSDEPDELFLSDVAREVAELAPH